MNQLERNHRILDKYIPKEAVPIIAQWVYKYNFKLKVKKSRASKYGDYRPPEKKLNHVITINQDMNKYAFLVTLIHEVAHLCNYDENGTKVKPHGIEWKQHYRKLMQPFLETAIFPDNVKLALTSYMNNPSASSCSDLSLLRALKAHDNDTDNVLLESLPVGAVFTYNKKRKFIKGDKLRKRYKCIEQATKKAYLFNPLTEVAVLEQDTDIA